jgi:hypothetical protein
VEKARCWHLVPQIIQFAYGMSMPVVKLPALKKSKLHLNYARSPPLHAVAFPYSSMCVIGPGLRVFGHKACHKGIYEYHVSHYHRLKGVLAPILHLCFPKLKPVQQGKT